MACIHLGASLIAYIRFENLSIVSRVAARLRRAIHRIIKSSFIVDLGLVDARRARRNVTAAQSVRCRVLGIAVALTARILSRHVVRIAARVLYRRVLGLAVATIGHPLLQQGQTSSSLFNVTLRVVCLPVRSQMARVLRALG